MSLERSKLKLLIQCHLVVKHFLDMQSFALLVFKLCIVHLIIHKHKYSLPALKSVIIGNINCAMISSK